MGKLYDRLQKQLKSEEHKKDAEDCLRRGFNVPNYSENWEQVLMKDYWNNYVPTKEEELLIQRITERIQSSSKVYFHYKGKRITKEKAIEILNLK